MSTSGENADLRQVFRFVALHHTGVAEPHFDVMVERAPGEDLVTWRSPAWPMLTPTVLTRLPDHRRHYLTYEGPVSGGRGEVRRVFASDMLVDIATLDGQTTWTLTSTDSHEQIVLHITEKSDGSVVANG